MSNLAAELDELRREIEALTKNIAKPHWTAEAAERLAKQRAKKQAAALAILLKHKERKK